MYRAGSRRSPVAVWWRRDRTPRSWTRGLLFVLPVSLAAGLAAVAPSAPVAAAPKPAPKPACPAELPDERAALTTARICGGPVAIANLTSETDQAVATPTGAVRLEHNFRPVRVRAGGKWVEADPTLEPTEDGRIGAKAAAVTVTFADGKRDPNGKPDPMVTVADGKDTVSLASPFGELPEPQLQADKATYREVLPGVDLQLRADVDGYSQVLVVNNAEAATNKKLRELTFSVSGKGLRLRADKAGNLRVTNAKGNLVLTGNTPLMWDAAHQAATTGDNPADAKNGGRHATMATEVADSALTVTPDRTLLDDPATVYPVYIDPGVTANRSAWAAVDSATPTTAYWNGTGEAQVGTSNAGASTKRAFFTMNLAGTSVAGTWVTAANLELTETYAPSCTTRQLDLYGAGAVSSTTTWNNQPTWGILQSSATVAKGATGCPAGPVSMDATGAVRDAVAAAASTVTLGLRSPNETDNSYFKRFSNNPTLAITYTSYATTTARATAPTTPCVTGSTRPYINTATPLLQGRVADPEGATVRAEFEWAAAGGTRIGGFVTPTNQAQASGQLFATTVPGAALTNGGSYSWRVRGYDGIVWGPWSSNCEFTVDTTTPTAAPSVSSTAYPSGSWAGAAGTAGTFTFGASSVTDVAAYVYGLDTDPVTSVNAGTLGGTASATLTPASDGPHTLVVQSRDRGGNLSVATTYVFNVGVGAVTGPQTGDLTAGKVTLKGVSKPTSSGVTYQWRRADVASWVTIPATDVTTTGGGAITWPVATTGSGAYPNLVWNVAQTLNNAEAGADALDGPVQVRASFSGTGAGTSSEIDFTLDRINASAATAEVGPGSVNLITGNYMVDAGDAPAAGLGLQRSFNTRRAGDSDPMFGVGWTSSIGVPDAGSYTDLTVTGDLVQVGLADGATLGFAKKATTGGGADFTAQIGSEATTLTYTTTGDKYTLTEKSGSEVTFTRRTGDPAGLYTPTSMVASGTSGGSTISWEKVTIASATVVRPTRVLDQVPAGVTCTTLVQGCKALTFTYATATTATTATGSAFGDYLGRLKTVTFTAWDPDLTTPAMRTMTLAQYNYDTTGRLREAWDPRLNYTSGGTQRVITAYTYNADGTLASLTPPGEQAWQFTYTTIPGDGGAGRLYKVTRSALSAGTAVQSLVYNVPITGSSGPVDMSAANIARWGQTEIPAYATSIYPESIVPDGNPATGQLPSWPGDDRVTVTYMDADGRETNAMTPGGFLSATWFDQLGNSVRELSARNLERALWTSGSDTPAEEAAMARKWSTDVIYSADGQRLLEMLEPEQEIVLPDWSNVRGRAHTTNTYDQGAPGGGPYNVVTTETRTLQYVLSGATVDVDKRVTQYEYDWNLRQSTAIRVDPDGLNLVTRIGYDTTTGQIISTTMPAGDAAGTTPATRKTVYYRAGTGSGYTQCDNKAHWDGLPCRVFAAAQPGGVELPFQLITYDMFEQPRTIVDSNSTTTLRTTTITYDGAGRSFDTVITSSVGTAIEKRRDVYGQATGRNTVTQVLNGSDVVTASITRGYDTLGRLIAYTDADGNISSTTYDIASRPATVNDGKGTQTVTYNGGDELRGLPTQVVDSQGGTFAADYDGDGNIISETRPDGLTVRRYYNETARPTGVEYVTSPDCWTAECTLYYDYTGSDVHDQVRWDASSFSDSGYGYDEAGRLTGASQDTAAGCALRNYEFDRASNRTKLTTYSPDVNGDCQDSNPATTRAWGHDTADRLTNAGYSYDTLGRTLATPDDDSVAGDGAGNVANTYYTNDMARTVTQGSTVTAHNLDVLTERFRSYSTTTSGTTVYRVNHYSDDSDSPSWIAEDGWYTRVIRGFSGLAAQYTGAVGHLEWQITNLHGDVVAMRTAGDPGITATYVTDEYGTPVSTTPPRYGYLGSYQRSADNPGGLITMGVRLYNPTTGRFLSVDPIYGGNANPYVYPTDPINKTDLTGKIAPLAAAAAIIGAVASGIRAIWAACRIAKSWCVRAIKLSAGAIKRVALRLWHWSNTVYERLKGYNRFSNGLSCASAFAEICHNVAGRFLDAKYGPGSAKVIGWAIGFAGGFLSNYRCLPKNKYS